MYFLYLFTLYYTSTLLPSVNSYVVLAANLNDFRSLAKKYVPNKNLVDQIKVMVLETGHNNDNRETLKLNDLDRTLEYVEEEQDDAYEVQKPVYKHQLKTLLDSQDPSPIRPLAAPTVITVDDLVDELKHRILQEAIDKKGDHNAQVYTKVNDAPAEQLETVVYKTLQKNPKSQVKNSVPMNIFKEEIQFEGTYEDAIEEDAKPQIQYLGQIQIPAQYLKRKPVKDEILTKKIIPKKHRFVSPKHFGTGKKVRYVKQVLVPSKLKQGLNEYEIQPSLVQLVMQQPSLGQKASLGQQTNFGQKASLGQHTSLGQQPKIVKPSMLEPQLSLMQHSSEMKLPLDQQPSIVQHLALMKQQIDRLNKIVEQNLSKNKQSTTSEAPQPNMEVIEAPFEIVENSEEDVQKTNDSNEDQVQIAEDTLSEETATEPVVSETSTKVLSDPTQVENEQFIEDIEEVEESAGHEEEHTPETVENNAQETKPFSILHKKVTESHSNYVKETTPNDDNATTPAEAILVKADILPRLEDTPKIHTQEFGNPAAGEPIVEKTYNFNAPIAETKVPVNLKLPVDSARKVLLF